jgi:hypothetical protein
MPPFVRVEDRKAGPTAMGILIPPGQRTIVILRPRPLPWDLLAGQLDEFNGQVRLCDFARDDAAELARQVVRQLEAQAQEQRPCVEVHCMGNSKGTLVWLRHGEYVWTTCSRRPGLPYEVHWFVSVEEAQSAADRLAEHLCPAQDAAQEYYFNTQHFHSSR